MNNFNENEEENIPELVELNDEEKNAENSGSAPMRHQLHSLPYGHTNSNLDGKN